MSYNAATKGEKSQWTRVRRWLCFLLLLFVMTTSLLFFYDLSLQVSWPLNSWTTWLKQSYNNVFNPAHNESGQRSTESEREETSTGKESGQRSTESEREETSTGKVPSPQCFVAYPHHYNFILDEPNRCTQESPFVVLMVPVEPRNREARDVIRNTWGKETIVLGQEIGHYFLLGRSREEDGIEDLQEQLLQESRTHHDIIQSDFLDSYNNLTIKTMVMFEWLSTHCPDTSYAMKVDSDMFLNVPNLVDMLLKAPQHLYMTGLVVRGAAVLRDHTSKWFLPYSAFPESTYPPYPLGMSYVFSLDLPKKILEASAHVKAVYIEDVYVGLCMKHLGIALTDPPDSGLFRNSVPFFTSSCYWTSVITTLLENSNQLSDVWGTYQTQSRSGC